MKRVPITLSIICVASLSLFVVRLAAQVAEAPTRISLDPTLLAAAIVTVLAATGGVVVQIINAASAARDRRDAASERKVNAMAAAETGKKADQLIEKVAEVHTLTNSTNSNLQKALEIMTEKFQGSERKVADMEATRKETASVQALRDQSAAPTAPAAPLSTAAAIIETADNTKAIEKNTAKTDATIEQLKKSAT